MDRPRICLAIVDNDREALREAEPLADLLEVRLDLVGPGWPELAKSVRRPWIATDRRKEEGGRGETSEAEREAVLLRAVEAGASIVDIEYQTGNLAEFVPLLKARVECLISYHDLSGTPSFEALSSIVENQIKAGADICKVVTFARDTADNLTVLRLVHEYRKSRIVAFAMGEAGRISRVLSPLAGAYFTYASIRKGKESAQGQLSIEELKQIFRYLAQ